MPRLSFRPRVAVLCLCLPLLLLPVAAAAQSEYSPSALVRLTHRTPHLTSGLRSRDNDFALDSGSTGDLRSTAYGRSVLVLPILIGCVGMLMGFAFMLSVIARICFKSCRFEPDRDEVKGVSRQELQRWTKTHIARREKKKAQFILFFTLALGAIHVAYLGNQYLSLGFNAVGSLDYVDDVFSALEREGDSLSADGDELAAGLGAAAAACPEVAAAQGFLLDYEAAVAEFEGAVDPVPAEVDKVARLSRRYGLVWRNLSMYCLYGAVMLLLVVYGVAYFFTWRSMMALVTVFNLAVMFFLLLACVTEMIVVMLSADFCMDPALYAVQVVPAGAVQDNLAYYLSCSGVNPAGPSVLEARVSAQQLNATLATLTSTTCPGNADLIALYSTTASIDGSINSIEELLQCPPVQYELESLLFDSLCDDTFMGLYIMWVSQYSTILFLFLLCIVGSVIHNFFGAFWYVNIDDVSVLERASKRHEAVERALRTGGESRNLDESDGSDDDEGEEDFGPPPAPASPSTGAALELDHIRAEAAL